VIRRRYMTLATWARERHERLAAESRPPAPPIDLSWLVWPDASADGGGAQAARDNASREAA